MNYSLNIGDILIRQKSLGLVDVPHQGVVVGYDAVLTNTPDRGEHVTSYEDFASGQEVRVECTGADSSTVIARTKAILTRPKKYNGVFRNCQHTVSEAVYGISRSTAVAIVFGIIVLFIVVAYLCRRK